MFKKIICLFTLLFLTINSKASDRSFASGILRENRKPTGLSDALLSREEFIYENRDIKHQISKFIQTKEILSLWRQKKIDKFTALRDFFIAVNQHCMDADYVKQEFRELVRTNSHIFNNDLDNLFSFANSLLRIRKIDERIIEILNEIRADLQHQINLGHTLINNINEDNFEYATELIKNGAAINIDAYFIVYKAITSGNMEFLKIILEQADSNTIDLDPYHIYYCVLCMFKSSISTNSISPEILLVVTKFCLSGPLAEEPYIGCLLSVALSLNKRDEKIEVIKLLLSKCEIRSVSLRDSDLNCIIETNDCEILKLLIDKGVKVSLHQLAIATNYGHREIIKLLLDYVELEADTIGWIICQAPSDDKACSGCEYLLSTTKRYKTIDCNWLLTRVNKELECTRKQGEKRKYNLLRQLKLTNRFALEGASKYSAIAIATGAAGYLANSRSVIGWLRK